MPEPAKFLRAFGLTKGARYGNYVLTSAKATHNAIERWQLYEYHIHLVLSPVNKNRSSHADMDAADLSLVNSIKGFHDVKATRNYYRCTIEPPHTYYPMDNGDIEFDLVGHGKRI